MNPRTPTSALEPRERFALALVQYRLGYGPYPRFKDFGLTFRQVLPICEALTSIFEAERTATPPSPKLYYGPTSSRGW